MGLPARPAPGPLHWVLPRIWPYLAKIKSGPAAANEAAANEAAAAVQKAAQVIQEAESAVGGCAQLAAMIIKVPSELFGGKITVDTALFNQPFRFHALYMRHGKKVADSC